MKYTYIFFSISTGHNVYYSDVKWNSCGILSHTTKYNISPYDNDSSSSYYINSSGVTAHHDTHSNSCGI